MNRPRRDSLTIMKQRIENSKKNEPGILRASNSQFDYVFQDIPQKSTLNVTTDPLVPTSSGMFISNIYIPSQQISHSQPTSNMNLNLGTSAKENNIGTVIKKKDKKKNKKVSELNLNERNNASKSQFDNVTQNAPQKSTLKVTTDPMVPTSSGMFISNIYNPSQQISHSQPTSNINFNLDISAKENDKGTVIKKKDKKKNKKVPELNLNERNNASNSQFDYVTQNIPQKSTLNVTTDPLVPTSSGMFISNIYNSSQMISHSQPTSNINFNLDISAKENVKGTVIKKKDKKKNKKVPELNLNERNNTSNSQFDYVTQNIPQKSTLNVIADPLVPTSSRMLISNIYNPSQQISHCQPTSNINFNLDISAKENDKGTVIKKKDKKKNKKVPELNLNERNNASNSQFDYVTQNIPQKSTLNVIADPLVPTSSRMFISNTYNPSQMISHSQPTSNMNFNLVYSTWENNISKFIYKREKFFRRNILLSLMEKKTHNPLSPRPLSLYDFLSLFQKYYLALLTPNKDHVSDIPVNKKQNRTAKKSDPKSKRPIIQHSNVKKVKIHNENKNKKENEFDDDDIIFTEPGKAYSQCLKMFGKMTKKMRRDFFIDEESFIFVK